MTDFHEEIRIWGLVPAAGLSGRMGRPKQTLGFAGTTITGCTVAALLEAGVSGVAVVTRSDLVEKLQLAADPRVLIAFNDAAGSQMIDSVRIGLSVLAGLRPGNRDGVMVVPGDMPELRPETCRKCAAAYRTDPQRIVIATSGARRGHPLVFPLAMHPIVDGLVGGLNLLPRKYPDRVHLLPVADPGTCADVDSPNDYRRLLDRSG
jgi:molybdenum cofactor cytidylyltransferase